MTNDHLLPDELAMRERCDRATRGPWFPVKIVRDFIISTGDSYDDPIVTSTGDMGMPTLAEACANAKLMAHARADLPELLTRLAAERAEVERLRGPQTLSIADDAPISGYAEYECFPGKLIACTGSVEIEIEETGHGGFGGCKHTIDFPGVKTVRQLRMLLEMLGTPTPAE